MSDTDIQKQAKEYASEHCTGHGEISHEKWMAVKAAFIAGYQSRDTDIAAIKAENAKLREMVTTLLECAPPACHIRIDADESVSTNMVSRYMASKNSLRKFLTDQNSKHEKD